MVQAKNIPTEQLLGFVNELDEGIGVHRVHLAARFPQFPPKVVYAKANRLVRKGRLDGCVCGCGGWYSAPTPQGDTDE